MSIRRKESTHQGGLRVATDDPHLVSLGGGRLSTAVTIHHLPLGSTTIGSSVDCSVVLSGPGVQSHHCTLYRAESGEVTLIAEKASRIRVDGKKVSDETILSQGSMLTVGKSNYLRFNNPAEAELLRSTIGSKEAFAMAHVDITHDSTSSGGSSANGSPADVMMKTDPNCNSTKKSSILETVSKAEFPSNINNFHSPKVFAADSLTVNTPARDVLGAKFNNFTKNLTHMFGNSKGVPTRANNNVCASSGHSNVVTSQSHQPLPFGLVKVNNTSPIATPVLASPKIQQFSACYDRYPKPGSYGSLQVFPMNKVNSEINTKNTTENTPMVKLQSPISSLTELQRQRAHIERIQEQEVSKKEHERLDEILKMCADFELQNQDGPSGTFLPSPVVQNRIKTNGSLPRDQKSHSSNSMSPESYGPDRLYSKPLSDDPCLSHTKSGYENVQIDANTGVDINVSNIPPPSGYENIPIPKKTGYVPQSPRNRIKTCVSPKKDSTSIKKNEYGSLVQSFEDKLLLEIQLIRENKLLNNGQIHDRVGDIQQCASSVEVTNSASEKIEKRNKNVNNLTLILKKDVDLKRCEQLRAHRMVILNEIHAIKAQISEIQQLENEVNRGLNIEKALVSAEMSTEQAYLQTLQRNVDTLQNKIRRMESQRKANCQMQESQQAHLKITIESKQSQITNLEALLETNMQDNSIRDELNATIDEFENESKNYEDLEFQHLEEEAEWSAYHEELHHDLRSLSKMVSEKIKQIATLQTQGIDNHRTACVDTRVLASELSQLNNYLVEKHESLKTIDQHIFELTGELNTLSESEDDDELVIASSHAPSDGNCNDHMSQSLFTSHENLSTNNKPLDIMSRSINENMLYQDNIESRTPFSSTPKRGGLITDFKTSHTNSSPISLLKYNLSPPFQHKSPSLPESSDEASRNPHLNLSIESDDFEGNPLEKRVPSQDDIDRICKVTFDAPISMQGASNKVIESIKEIERNRQLLLAQQGSQVIEHERQKMSELKKKSHDEARAQYLKWQETSTGDDPNSYNHKECSLENVLCASIDADENENQEPHDELKNSTNNNADTKSQRYSQPELDHMRPLSDANSEASYEVCSDKPFKSTNDIRGLPSHLHERDNYEMYRQHRQNQEQRDSQLSRCESTGLESDDISGLNSRMLVAGSKRNLPKHQRPLTRYLPIMSLDLDLRHHIESAGHQVALCPHILLDAYSCRGYLHKLGATFHGWSRRWFLFDRQKMALIYFSDKSERKPRGGAYFSTIDEVYLDHMNTSKSGRPHCTFIVKTKKRSYHLQAASDAAARIWIDAIITGAQGNIDY